MLADYKLVICDSRAIYFISTGIRAIPLSIEITNVIFWLLLAPQSGAINHLFVISIHGIKLMNALMTET